MKLFFHIKPLKYYLKGRMLVNDAANIDVSRRSLNEMAKQVSRTEVINYLLIKKTETNYLEIGVRDPSKNFDKISATHKYSVDPGVEFTPNPVDFPMTSDDFFGKLSKGEILSADTRFDVIFIDGLHLAEQVDRDIRNALLFLKDDGFIVLHDCNPPSEWHARETYSYRHSPAGRYWNGTTWKAFVKWRGNKGLYSCCIDSDWGVGIISKNCPIGEPFEEPNEFYEFSHFEKNRTAQLNLMDFEVFKKKMEYNRTLDKERT
jgi:hypothetical protein